jgi:hypothetical protein
MNDAQETHLRAVKCAFVELADKKYRKGAEEHGDKLLTNSPLELLDMAIDEAIDQVIYLLTLKATLEKPQ